MAGEIFISYRRADQAKAGLLYQLLKDRGVDAWYDALLDAGDDWRNKTANALVAASIFVLLFSKTAAQSDDISKELAAATFQKKTVIPVRLDDIHPEGAFLYELASRNWFDAFDNTEARLAVLADRLAALVKGAPEEARAAALKLGAPIVAAAPQAPLKENKDKKEKLPRGLVTLGIVGIIAAAVVAIVWSGINSPDDEPAQVSGYRTAFFGFTATGDDSAVASAVTTATEEGFRLLDLVHVDAVSRAETTVAQTDGVLERADDLGAHFAVTGEIRREGDVLKATVRVVDVPSRTTLAQRSFEGPVAKPTQIAYRIGSSVAGLPQCILGYIKANEDHATDASALPVIGKACMTELTGSQNSYRDLLRQLPDNGLAAARAADALVWNLATLPEAQRPAALAEADNALARAEQLAPEGYYTSVARLSVAIAHDRPPAEWLTPLEQALLRSPSVDETAPHGKASAIAGQMLLEAGRTQDAARYFRRR
jgi:hypothetical protein